MRIFGLSDLHLSFGTQNKSMDIFGPHWREHWRKIEENWHRLIGTDDIVLVNGDISWGLRPAEAHEDLNWVSSLPGTIVISKGNHDLWWQGISKMRLAYPKLHFIQNDALTIGKVSICGTRGWNLPGSKDYKEQDRKIYERELLRLQMAAKALDPQAEHRLAMLHFPPLFSELLDTEFTRILEEAQIELCAYGHLHGVTYDPARFDIDHHGIKYRLISSDYLDFCPKLLLEL